MLNTYNNFVQIVQNKSKPLNSNAKLLFD